MKPPSFAALALTRSLASRVAEVDPVCIQLRAWLALQGVTATFPIEIVARESLLNAVIHGNRFCADKEVEFQVHLRRNWIRLRVSDHGCGFAWRQRDGIPDQCAVHGRGLAIYRKYAERVRFNQLGNQVTFWFKRTPAQFMEDE